MSFINVSGNVSLGANVLASASFSAGGSASISIGGGVSAKPPGSRIDPYCSYNFLVEIDGIIAGGFSDVSGLGISTEVERKSFGGVNDFEHTFIKGTKHTDLTLKRGITDQSALFDWYDAVTKGNIQRKSGSIYLLDHQSQQAMCWNFFEGCPISWTGPVFNALQTTVAAETIVLVHHGLSKPQPSGIMASLNISASAGISVGVGISI